MIAQGAVTINVDRHFIATANTGNTVVLNNLTMNGGLLQVTGAVTIMLSEFDGTTTLSGQTNVFFPNTRIVSFHSGWPHH